MSAKISLSYWNTLTSIEQEYIKEHVYRNPKYNVINHCKEVIREARKQLPGFTSIRSPFHVEHNGSRFIYSGSDTRRFIKLL